MAIQRIESVTYGVDDLEESYRFFTDFGLEPVELTSTRGLLRTRVGQTVELMALDDPSLPPPVEEGPGIRRVVWGVDNRVALDTLIADLRTDREVTVFDSVAHTLDETGFGLGFAIAAPVDPDNEKRPSNTTGHVDRWNTELTSVGRVRPLRVCHVALNIPKDGREKANAFYLDRLHFRATDIVKQMGTFMQAEGDADQHNLLLCHRPDRAGTNHTSWEVSGFDDVIEGANHMIDQGWREARKLGRHTIGSNVFRFIFAPCGGRVELAADMDRVDESYGTRVHEETPPHHIWTIKSSKDNESSVVE